MALAELGRIDQAKEAIAATPLDCQPCVRARGIVAAKAGERVVADHWFGQAVRMAPSLPQANFEWGKALLERGDSDAAIARFAAAGRQSPNYPDPILYWGEALLAKGDARGAIGKFAQAEKIAPKWGRAPLKRGEALLRRGRTAQAQAKFKSAAALYLTPAERAELPPAMQGAR